MVDVQCPLPRALTGEDARSMFNTVKKEMPGLTAAAWRREAARRLGTDYNTFLTAWKTGKGVRRPPPTPPQVPGVPKPPIPDPPKPPGAPGPGTAMTRAEARALDKKVAKELGLKPGTAASRKAAAERAGMRYDDFLAAWKGEKPKIPTGPTPAPVPPKTPPSAPKVEPPPKAPKVDKRTVTGVLEKAGLRRSVKGKERRTHTGQVYGGGITESEGFVINSISGGTNRLSLSFRPGSLSPLEVSQRMDRITDILERAGYEVKPGLTNLQRIITAPKVWSQPGLVRKIPRKYQNTTRAIAETRTTARVKGLPDNAGERLVDLVDEQLGYAGKRGDLLSSVRHAAEDLVDPDYIKTQPNVLAYYRPFRHELHVGDKALARGHTAHASRMQHNNWHTNKRSHLLSEHGAVHDVHEHDGMLDTMAHEFGHFIDDVLDPDDRRLLMDTIRKDMGISEEDWKRLQGLDFNPNLSIDVGVKLKMKNMVSRYGSTNLSEMMAEIWGEYTRNPNPRPHIKKWGTMIQDILESY